jgi:hypothetical protein
MSIGVGGVITAIYVVVADLLSVLKQRWAIGGVAYGYRGLSRHKLESGKRSPVNDRSGSRPEERPILELAAMTCQSASYRQLRKAVISS